MNRTTHFVARFDEPFFLKGTESVQPAGDYAVDQDEERIEGPSFPVWLRTGTYIHLPAIAAAQFSSQMVAIQPAELEAAQMQGRA